MHQKNVPAFCLIHCKGNVFLWHRKGEKRQYDAILLCRGATFQRAMKEEKLYAVESVWLISATCSEEQSVTAMSYNVDLNFLSYNLHHPKIICRHGKHYYAIVVFISLLHRDQIGYYLFININRCVGKKYWTLYGRTSLALKVFVNKSAYLVALNVILSLALKILMSDCFRLNICHPYFVLLILLFKRHHASI